MRKTSDCILGLTRSVQPHILCPSSLEALRTLCIHVSCRPLAEDSGHSEHSGAEEAAHGPGHLHEDGGLLLHRHLLRSPVQRGNAIQRRSTPIDGIRIRKM